MQYTDTSQRDVQNVERVISILKGLGAVHTSVRKCRFARRERRGKKLNKYNERPESNENIEHINIMLESKS